MEIDKELIERYHLGLCNAQEIEAVQAWLESDEFDLTFLEDKELQQLENSTWEKLSERYDLGVTEPISPTGKTKIRRMGLTWRVAASIAMLLGLGVGYLLYNSVQHNRQKNNTQLSYQTIQTTKGQKLQVTLPDGTRIWMNSESTLRFPRQFSQPQRAVSFTGEGYFSVAKNPNKPFVITSNRTKIQVLGTRFNLRDYPDEQQSLVIVEEGKVRFTALNSQEQLILRANQKGNYNPDVSPALTSQQVYNTRKYIDWKDGKLLLDNLTLAEIQPILQRWYGVKLTIDNVALAQQRYTGSFENPGLKQVLESICFALKCSYRQQEHQNLWTIFK